MRFHTQTAGVSLTAQQPLNNIVRTAIEALAGVLGGTQSLHTNSFDEALALPTEEAVRVALRTQQIIAEETGVANTIDPLGGCYFVEALTDGWRSRRTSTSTRSTSSAGWSRRSSGASRSARSPTRRSATSRRSRRASAASSASTPTPRATTSPRRSCGSTRRSSASRSPRARPSRARRDGAAVERALEALVEAARDPDENLMPLLLEAARARRDRGRDRRGAAAGVRQLHRSAGLLSGDVFGAARRRRPWRRATIQRPDASSTEKKIRVVVAKPGLDGHDRGAKIIARALRDAGMEVIYTGLHQTPEQIVETVIQEDADAVGLSILSGAHMTLVPRIMRAAQGAGRGRRARHGRRHDPVRRRQELKDLGVAEVFTPGASTQQAVDFIRSAVRA